MIISTISNSEKIALLKIFPRGVIAVDLEFTGLSAFADKIIEISAIKLTSKGIEEFNSLINPQIPIPKMATDICGIKDEDVADSPTIKAVLKDLVNFLGDLPILAHNAKFDLAFIVFNLYKEGYVYSNSRVFCSINFARKSIPKMPNFRLATLIKELKLEGLTHHHAKDDAVACMRVFAQGLQKLEPKDLNHPAMRYAFQFKISDFSKNKDMTIPKHLLPTLSVIDTRGKMEIKYSGGNRKNEFRPIEPVAFLPMPGGNVLYAHCLESDIYKCYALKKIKEIKIDADK